MQDDLQGKVIFMKRLKVNFFIQKHKKILFLIAIIMSVGFGIVGIGKISGEMISDNPTMFGVAGTLIGAVIGGFFSLMGSVWVNSKQQKATQNIKRKNVIYSPIYDELVDIQNRILIENPYPTIVRFEKGMQTMLPHPQFSAWGRIKADTRYLEVPDLLAKQMEQLEEAVHKYQNIRGSASNEIQKIFNEILRKNSLAECSIINIGEVISKNILSNKRTDIYGEAMEFDGEKKLDNCIKMKINSEIYDMCNKNQVVLEARLCYENWLKIQNEAIQMLGLLIKQVLLKYEG